MGSYWSVEEITNNDVYTEIDEEKERKVIDTYVDNKSNIKNFWYYGYIEDLLDNNP